MKKIDKYYFWVFVLILVVCFSSCEQGISPACFEESNQDTISGQFCIIAESQPPESKLKEIQHRLKIANETNHRDADQLAYIVRFWDVAKKEEEMFGIPYAITLAQGILESGNGKSQLSMRYNNHFGIKCHDKACKKEFEVWKKVQSNICVHNCTSEKHVCGKGQRFSNGCCVNFADDSKSDRFKVYSSSWQSYREHSKFLQKSNYTDCHKCRETDSDCWSECLQRKGYATSQEYAKKLMMIIEKYNL